MQIRKGQRGKGGWSSAKLSCCLWLLVWTTGRSRSSSSLNLSKLFLSCFSAFSKDSHIRQIKGRDPALLSVGLGQLEAASGSSSSPGTYPGSLLYGAARKRTCDKRKQVLFARWFQLFLCFMSDCVGSPVLIKQASKCVSGSCLQLLGSQPLLQGLVWVASAKMNDIEEVYFS